MGGAIRNLIAMPLPTRLAVAALLAGALALAAVVGAGAQAPAGPPAGLIFRDAPARADGPAVFVGHSAGSRRPKVLAFSATPASLPASGGTVTLEALVANAKSCRFSAVEPLASLPRSAGCGAGHASVTVELAANTAATPTTYAFALHVAGTHGRHRTASVNVELAATAPPANPESATAPAAPSSTTTSAPPATSEPMVTADPVSETVAPGAGASFTASASGSPAPTVQWLVSSDGGTTWSPDTDPSATSATLSFTASASETGNEYEAVFTNSAGSATTTAATLTVSGAAPQVTTQPSDVTVPSDTTATFTAAASGNPAPTVQWQVSIDGGSWTDVSRADSDTYSFTASSGENGYQYRAVFTNSLSTADTEPATVTVAADQSTNWSGYAVTGQTFTAVTGAWTVPTVSCSSHTAYSAQWIGIDGYGSDTVEQDGTEANCFSDHASYDAWYEMYGDTAVYGGNEVELDEVVEPGDSMTASVSVSAGEWTLAISDVTQGWNYSTAPIPFAAAQSSAEWIGERPEVCSSSCSLTRLANFGSFAFTNATATAGGVSGPISSFGSYSAIEMVGSSNDELAAPGQLDATGESFTDTWYALS